MNLYGGLEDSNGDLVHIDDFVEVLTIYTGPSACTHLVSFPDPVLSVVIKQKENVFYVSFFFF